VQSQAGKAEEQQPGGSKDRTGGRARDIQQECDSEDDGGDNREHPGLQAVAPAERLGMGRSKCHDLRELNG
jgi:hypothetical protein